MSKERPRYLSYLLRLWQDNGKRRPVWRASLQSGLAGERQSFASLDELFAFLRWQAGIDSDTENGDGTGIRQNG